MNQFPGNLAAGNYWIIRKDADYNWIVVSEPKGRYLWIMSRDEKMDDDLLMEQIQWIEADGWEAKALIEDNDETS